MQASIGKRFPAPVALLAQLAALLAVWGLWLAVAGATGWHAPLMLTAIVQGLLAAGVGRVLGLSIWWVPINLAFVPGLIAVQTHSMPPWLLLAGFLVLLLLNWNALTERVPLYLTGPAAEARLIEHLKGMPVDGLRFIDLGCGLGGTLARLARRFPDGQFSGVETSPLTFALAWLRCLPRRNCRIRPISLWRVDLGGYDLVYCFLSPAPMPGLRDKALREMRPGAWLISNSFAIPEVEADLVLEVGDWRGSRLYAWRPRGVGAAPDATPASG